MLRSKLVRLLAGLALIFALTIDLESTPPLWWDEGWNLSVARNWVELGHYGRLLDGERVSAGMSTGFPAVAPVAMSFRFLGVGIWQGRLVGVFFTVGALALLYYLASHLYSRSVAIATLVVVVLLSPVRSLHPVVMGRQVLGETPALVYLLAGYAFFRYVWHRPLWFLPLAATFWAIALITKLQVLPFWAASLLVPLSMALFRRSWRSAYLLGVGLVGSFIASRLLLWLEKVYLHGQTGPEPLLYGLYDVTALVPVASVRLAALLAVSVAGLLTLLGLCYEIRKLIRIRKNNFIAQEHGANEDGANIVGLALVVLSGTWLAWYLLFSVAWARYLYPAIFIGSIFVAAMLRELTNHYSLSSTVTQAGHALRYLRFDRQNTGIVLITILIGVTFLATLQMLYRSYAVSADKSVLQVADFLNTQTATNALIETYESELFFLLNRRYHYPPDQIHIELNRRTFLNQDVPIEYDPLASDPDYLVIGPANKLWRLYSPILTHKAFRMLRTYGRYTIFERVR